MKKTLILLLFFVPFLTQAQLAVVNDYAPLLPRNNENKGQRFSFFLDYGIFPMKIKKSEVIFSYTDESPSPDNITQNISFKGSNYAKGFSGGFEWQTRRDLFFRVFLGGGKGAENNTSTNQFVFGGGYALGGERFQFYPYLDFLMINANMDLASLKKSSGYIEINKVEFYGSELTTRLATSFVGFRPSLGANFFITKRIGIHANAGWLLGRANGTTSITFKGEGIEGSDGVTPILSATENISESNLSLKVDGVRNTKNASFFVPNGLSFTVGLTFNFTNRLFDGK